MKCRASGDASIKDCMITIFIIDPENEVKIIKIQEIHYHQCPQDLQEEYWPSLEIPCHWPAVECHLHHIYI